MKIELKRLSNSVDLVLRAYGLVPPPVVHNLAKSRMLKMIFWHLAVDQTPGCYVEFGVATGNSMRSAEIAERRSHSSSLGIKRVRRTLYGFDTFDSFASTSEDDLHPAWNGNKFTSSKETVEHRFKKTAGRVHFHALDLTKATDESGVQLIPVDDYISDATVAVALFDMDLGEPTFRALEWIEPKLQSGCMLIFDEFLAFGGDANLGEAGALARFLARHPELSLRQFGQYGDGGTVFQVTRADQRH
jgi:hypothetical protein